MEKTLRHSLQSLGVVRFNPFSDVGGDQSFAVAMVDGHGNGVVISSLYGRHDVKVYAKPLKKLATAHPEWIAFSDSWKTAPEPLHYAAADMLLMPSLFEPCGLPHMMALRYGTIPIVRQTGGLADVVQDYDRSSKTGNGFVFRAPDVEEMLHATGRSLETYHQHPDHWRGLMATAMQARDQWGHDFTWTTAANRYLTELYESDDRADTGQLSAEGI